MKKRLNSWPVNTVWARKQELTDQEYKNDSQRYIKCVLSKKCELMFLFKFRNFSRN